MPFRPYKTLATLILGLGISGVAFAAGQDTPPTAGAGYYNTPLAAGTLTLQDVLEAHKPAAAPLLPPVAGGAPTPLTSPGQPSSTSLMMSQGMKAVLQKVGDGGPVTAIKPPRMPGATDTQVTSAAPTAPIALAPDAALAAVPAAPASNIAVNADGFKYEPGRAPKTLSGTTPIVEVAPVAATPIVADTSATAAAPAGESCGKDVEKWEKTCAEAGYPASYMGKIVGETRTGCGDGMLHDVWVTNSCAPPENATASTARTDGACGPASNNDFDTAPTSSLCAQGVASAVNGDGPWTWACSGVNGGTPAACVGARRVPLTNGSCGSANGVATGATPSEDLCNAGEASVVKGHGPWTWTCKGQGKGRVESCIAPALGGASNNTAPAIEEAPVAAAPVAAAPVARTAAPSEKGELCGAAAETLAYQAPDKDLCRAGTPGMVSGSGPWSWSCSDNAGTTSSCRTLALSGASEVTPAAVAAAAVAAAVAEAPVAETPAAAPTESVLRVRHKAVAAPTVSADAELACGLAASQPAFQTPTTELCQGGKASGMRGSGPWRWNCSKGKQHLACETPRMVDGACGAANGSSLKSAPFSGLCAVGTPSSISGDGPWNWTCNGTGGGTNVSCAASVQSDTPKLDGACGTSDGAHLSSIPSDGLCAAGTASAISGDGPWSWSCAGANGGAVGACSATKVAAAKPPGQPVNGLCGSANGATANAQPAENLCSSGTPSGVVGNGPWNWTCGGANAGMTVSCTAPLEPPAAIDGTCGRANGVATLVKPQSGLCDSGITGNVNGRGPWTWTCSGANGGNPSSCVAPMAGKSGSMPSSMTVADSGGDTMPTPDAAPSGLVTPHLANGSGATPALDKKTLPSLSSFAIPPTPSKVPPAARVRGTQAPLETPTLPAGSQPVTPPSVGIQPAPALQEEDEDLARMQKAASIPGNHLELDPTISTVLFPRGSGNIAENVLVTLDKLSNVLVNNPDVRIALTAYADNTGSTPRDARKLSLTRAIAVRDYLASKGIAESRIDIHAEGANTASGYIDRVDVKAIE